MCSGRPGIATLHSLFCAKQWRKGVNHIDTSDYYGPHTTNQLIREALHPYSENLTIVTKVGGSRGADASWNPAQSPAELISAVHDNQPGPRRDRCRKPALVGRRPRSDRGINR